VKGIQEREKGKARHTLLRRRCAKRSALKRGGNYLNETKMPGHKGSERESSTGIQKKKEPAPEGKKRRGKKRAQGKEGVKSYESYKIGEGKKIREGRKFGNRGGGS